MDVELTVQILPEFSASKIASPSPFFMKFKFLAIVNPILSFPVYSPDAIQIVSPSWASFKDSLNVLNASFSLFPSPLVSLLELTYQSFPAVNNSSLDDFKISLLFTLLSADNKLFSRLIDSSMEITSVSLASAALADVINRNKIKTDKTTNKCFLNFIYYSPSKQRLLKESFYQFYT